MSATTIYPARVIHTMEPAEPTAEAVAIEGDRIVGVGTVSALVQRFGPDSTVDETFADSVILPGLIDQHLHPLLAATTLTTSVISTETWELPEATFGAAVSQDDYRHKLAAAEADLTDPDEWLFSWGYHQLWHGHLDRSVLDTISSTRPIGIWQRSCHEWYLNSAGLDALGLNAEWLATRHGPDVEMVDLDAGHFWEGGFFNLIMKRVAAVLITPERMERGLRQMVAYLHQNGVTAFNEPGISWAIEPFELYQEVLGHPDVPLWSTFLVDGRVQAARRVPPAEVVDDALEQIARAPQVDGPDGKVCLLPDQVKLFADGAIISQLMQMNDPYLDQEGNPDPHHHGEWLMEPETYRRYFDAYWDQGWQIHTHVNGDAGLEMVLDTLEAAQRRTPRHDHRCVIVHFANSTEAQVDRIAALGAIVSANPYYPCGFADRFGEHGLGPDRADAMVRARSVVDRGVSLSYHSDLPMGPAEPLKMASFGVNRFTESGRVAAPEQRIDIDAALRAVTIEAAYSWRQEDEIGSIAVGKRANLTVVAQDPYTEPPVDLGRIEVIGTFYDGRWHPVPAADRSRRRWRSSGQGHSENATAGLPSTGFSAAASGCSCVAAGALADALTAVGNSAA